jgi:hypothetical protein
VHNEVNAENNKGNNDQREEPNDPIRDIDLFFIYVIHVIDPFFKTFFFQDNSSGIIVNRADEQAVVLPTKNSPLFWTVGILITPYAFLGRTKSGTQNFTGKNNASYIVCVACIC